MTLIELLITLTLVGLVLAIALPKLEPMRDGAGLRSARQVVQSYLATARQTAMRRGGTARLVVNGNNLSVTSIVDGVTTAVVPPVNVAEQFGASLTSNVSSIEYNSRGFARLSAPGTIRFARNGVSDSVCVTLLGMVGRCGL